MRRGAAGAGPFTDVTSRGQSRRAATMLTTQQCRHHRRLLSSVMLYSLYFDLPWKLYCFIDGMPLSYITDSCRYYIHLERAARVSQRNGVHCSYGRGRYPAMKYDNTVIRNCCVKFVNREHLHRAKNQLTYDWITFISLLKNFKVVYYLIAVGQAFKFLSLPNIFNNVYLRRNLSICSKIIV